MAADLFSAPDAGGKLTERRHREHLPRGPGGPGARPLEPRHRRTAAPHGLARPTPPSPRRPTTWTSSTCSSPWAPTAASTRPRRTAAVTDRTALLVGSAPCYPYGVIDPIPELAALAAEREPALPRRRLPRRLAAPVLGAPRRARAAVGPVRGRGHLAVGGHPQVRVVLQGRVGAAAPRPGRWSGTSTSSTTTGPAGCTAPPRRPAPVRRRPIAAAWATISHLGEAGYLRLADAGPRRHPPLPLRHRGHRRAPDHGRPRHGRDGDRVDVHDLNAVGDVMDDRGWHLDRQQGGLHLMLSPYHLDGRRRVPRPTSPRPWPSTARAGAWRRPTAASPSSAVPERPRFAGAILCGGASRRMGHDKALLPIDGRPMAARVCRRPLGRRSGGGGRHRRRRSGARPRSASTHRLDDHPGDGPLPATITALLATAEVHVLVVSCDLVAPDPAAMAATVHALASHPGAVGAVPVDAGHRQWTHAAWRADAARPLAAAHAAGARSLRRAGADLLLFEVHDLDPAALADADEPSDLPGSLPRDA